ncbi:AbrB/MazE/SpoVT family DNA-binding domain-containing protein [Lacisediminihabitans profunda]|uniref:AbrB/MazE/SpoVT family DNA-binding domain-containing protein n=1 Tax=Lacisediminihabitans profunda TaxID=2594790 RepID=A0A5C8UTZ2_9MICO|nr:AbrB/MazE/SpoVT family DNA-binding domain-containing protein [Lacisediminihabitans profunda]TXN31096.1 AbrB/MazE/SpoVT family DNA-binding domain-containing protein [Lacisediminihabitans profunda]
MSGTHTFTVGDRGRVVLPAQLRKHRGWPVGTTLVAVETASGVVVASRDELESIVKAELAGTDLVSELLAERRAAAQRDDRG